MANDWEIGELAHAGEEHLDPGFVAAYDRNQAFDPTPDVAVLPGYGLGRESSLVDLGAGTGKLALAAAAEFGRVVAVEVSPAMLDVFRSRVAEGFDAAVEDPTRGYTRDDFVEHIRTEHSTYRWLFEPMLDVAGFDVVDVEFRRSVYGAYTCVKR